MHLYCAACDRCQEVLHCQRFHERRRGGGRSKNNKKKCEKKRLEIILNMKYRNTSQKKKIEIKQFHFL